MPVLAIPFTGNSYPAATSLVAGGYGTCQKSVMVKLESARAQRFQSRGVDPCRYYTRHLHYDVAYDRVLAPPATDTGNGVLHGNCIPGRPNGTRTEYEEGDDIDQTLLNGGGPYSTYDGGVKSIDPNKLIRDPYNGCAPVYPWNFVRANTIYGVIHKAGGYTA
jgi:hypothetical protein